jgi:MFS transporter, PAT family, beta-lactamase induction signal transducer AmpG
MSRERDEIPGWAATCRAWLHPRAIAMLFLGFSAGIPLLLMFSTLSVWLREAGVDRSTVTFFSWAALGYSFKFLWAPIVDLLPLPFLTHRLGRRRGWLLLAQLLIIAAIVAMASIDPAENRNDLKAMAMAAILLGFSSATQDVVIDAYRIESAEQSLQALLASMYIAGYRMGMLVAGAGSLLLADYLGGASGYSYQAWRATYLAMAVIMGGGLVTTLCVAEPEASRTIRQDAYSVADYLRFVALFVLAMAAFALTFFKSAVGFAGWHEILPFLFSGTDQTPSLAFEVARLGLAAGAAAMVAWLAGRTGLVNRGMVRQAYYAPVQDFFVRYGGKTALLLLALIGCYRLSDIVLGVVSNIFYLDMGFSKTVIAGITKSFGLAMTLAGGFFGGLLTLRYGVKKILFLGAFLSAATNLLFMLLAGAGGNVTLLTLVIGADNLSAGIASTAFVAFLSSLTSVAFTAVQYAIFSSMMTLLPKMLGGYAGTMVSVFGYQQFFLVTAAMGIPVLLLIVVVLRLGAGAVGGGRQ